MAQKSFASGGTVKKLETVFDYGHFYTKALTGKFNLKYLDVFSGTGEIPTDGLPLMQGIFDYDGFVQGSALRALDLEFKFHEYHFSDVKNANILDLQVAINRYPELKDRVFIKKADANDMVREFCANLKPSDRALVFLDPFGHQLSWQSLQLLAATRKVDVWYLFPAGSVMRQVKQNGEILPDPEPSLDRMFGTMDWRNVVLAKAQPSSDLFGTAHSSDTRIATTDSITRFMISRMKEIFAGGVLDSWLPTGRSGRHTYSLLFAWSNPSDNASHLARRVGNQIMTRK